MAIHVTPNGATTPASDVGTWISTIQGAAAATPAGLGPIPMPSFPLPPPHPVSPLPAMTPIVLPQLALGPLAPPRIWSAGTVGTAVVVFNCRPPAGGPIPPGPSFALAHFPLGMLTAADIATGSAAVGVPAHGTLQIIYAHAAAAMNPADNAVLTAAFAAGGFNPNNLIIISNIAQLRLSHGRFFGV